VSRTFHGSIGLDITESRADWSAFRAAEAPAGSPNVLVVLYDDTGQATWSPYGGRVEMPTLDRLAANGLTYTQWHTVALCAPTRSCMLNGRAHHQNGCATIAESATGFPNNNSHIPMENAFLAEVLRERGWATFWVGKNHNVPIDEWDAGAPRRNWPLARGFDRFYGFFGGETNNWYPDLAEDNRFVDQPYGPEDGYHLSRDLADRAIGMIRDVKQTRPDKPWYMFYCPGANHAPHHAPQEYIEKYRGAFDDGYDAYRHWVLARMIERGILPEGTDLTPFNPMPEGTFSPADAVRPWESLNDDEKRLFSRMAEVFAAFSEYTDAQIGRLVDYLEESGQLDNTIIFYCADNGASGEGTPNGMINEGMLFNSYPTSIEDNLAMIDRLGSPDTYNHYPTGWAAAFSTPYRMFKRYSYQGGVADPLVIHWPAGIDARGEVRNQYHHVTDIVPTILDCLGLEMPDKVLGYDQTPLPGVSMRYTFDADGPTRKTVQYYEMLGTRAIWSEGWKAVAVHGPFTGMGNFENDGWQLFHTDVDRAEAHDLADQHPEKVEELKALWLEEADRHGVLPLMDVAVLDIVKYEFHPPVPPGGQFVYYPGTSDVPERLAANTHGVSWKAIADVELAEDAEGVIWAHGSRFGGHALFLRDGELHYAYNFLGLAPEQRLVAEAPRSGRHTLGVEFTKDRIGEHGEAYGPVKLHIDEQVVADGEIRTMTGHFTCAGEGLCIGYDSGDQVSALYRDQGRFPFTGGTLHKVVFDVNDDAYVDLEAHLDAALARD
jgi:arylsulfatase